MYSHGVVVVGTGIYKITRQRKIQYIKEEIAQIILVRMLIR